VFRVVFCDHWSWESSCRCVRRTTEVLNRRISQTCHNALNVLGKNFRELSYRALQVGRFQSNGRHKFLLSVNCGSGAENTTEGALGHGDVLP
jgi:hypothetical protein